jgi:hypothetical protein
VQLTCLLGLGLGLILLRISRMVAEGQRLTRAVAGLVIQEEDRARALFRESR